MATEVDLTQYSTTLCNLPVPHCTRDNLVKWLRDRFTEERKVIVVQGPDGAGKTVLLAHFVNTYRSRCFCFFVGGDVLSSPRTFLLEMCAQMDRVVGTYRGEIDDALVHRELKDRFQILYRRAAKQARHEKEPFYFVVDGLEHVPESHGEESIFDLLPKDPPNGIFLLASSTQEQPVLFAQELWQIPFFSYPETLSYFQDMQLEQTVVRRVYDACEGMPGYLTQIRREIQSGLSADEVLADLPQGFRNLLERQWRRADIADEETMRTLAVLAYGELPLDICRLAGVAGVDMEFVRNRVTRLPFLRSGHQQRLTFVTDAHRRFAAGKLTEWRGQAEMMLIRYYEKEPFSKESLRRLPALYAQSSSYDALKHLVNTDYMVRTLKQEKNLDLLHRDVRIVAQEAHKAQDWQALSQYALLSSVFRALITESTAEHEIEALLALGDYAQALELAYRAVLPDDRLQLLARVGSHLRQQAVPIPPTVVSDISNMVDGLEPAETLYERMIEIAADLFYVNAEAAVRLVDKVAGTSEGKSMDVVLAVLSLRLTDEVDSQEAIRTRIVDQSLRDFARAHSPVVAKLTPEQAISEAEEVTDVSGKLFLLRSWCNSNRGNPDAIVVVNEALQTMTQSTGYSASMRHLRQFAEPLISCETNRIGGAVECLDLLKATAIGKPDEELVRLELLLAAVEARESPEKAIPRLYQVYLDLDNIAELDVRSYCLVRVLMSLSSIDPDDDRLRNEIEERLRAEYGVLLHDSADHWAIARRLLTALANYKPRLALELASKLNTKERRDRAHSEILCAYVDQEPHGLDLGFVKDTLDKISEDGVRDWTLLRMLERFAQRDVFASVPQSRCFMDRIHAIRDPRKQSYARAYALQMMSSAARSDTAMEQFELMRQAWLKIDSRWERVSTGFALVTIVAKRNQDLARCLLEEVRREQADTPLAEDRLAQLYVHVAKLAVRASLDILKSRDYLQFRDRLLDMIRLIPSTAVQCQLMADSALMHRRAGHQQEFERLVREDVLSLLESCNDYGACELTIIKVAPCLFAYERKVLEEYISRFSASVRDRAYWEVVRNLLSKRLPDDPVDLDSLGYQLDYADACRVCEAIAQLATDHLICLGVGHLVKSLIQKEHRGETCSLLEKHALEVARNLARIVEVRLPDPDNITHCGYRIAAQASLARLRAAQSQLRAPGQWSSIAPPWSEIARMARDVPNTADRALVMAWVAKDMYGSDPRVAHELLEEAKECAYQIPNIVDRACRLYAIAEAWQESDDRESAKAILGEAMSILQAWQWDQTRDQVTGQILQLAHSVDAEFASSLVSFVDNPVIQYRVRQDLASHDLKRKPEEVGKRTGISESLVIGEAAWRLLRSFGSGKGFVQHEKVTGQWVSLAADAEFDDAYKVMAWSVENAVLQTTQRDAPALTELYVGLLDTLSLLHDVGSILLLREASPQRANTSPLPGSSTLMLFSAGKRPVAETALQKWLAQTARSYVRIYDAYFTAENLDILRHIAPELRIDVFALWKTQHVPFGDRIIQKQYQDVCRSLFDQSPPEVYIHLVGIRSSGDGPIHDRYLTTLGAGLHLGPSYDGLGVKDTSIHVLDSDEAAAVESKFIAPLLLGSQRLFKGERLEILTFTL